MSVSENLSIWVSQYLSISESQNLGSLKSQIIINNNMVLPLPVHQKYGFQFWDLEILGWGFQDFLLKSQFSTGFQQIFKWKSWGNISKTRDWEIALKFWWIFVVIFLMVLLLTFFAGQSPPDFKSYMVKGFHLDVSGGLLIWQPTQSVRISEFQNLGVSVSKNLRISIS